MQNGNPYATPMSNDDAVPVGDAWIRITRTRSYADRIRAYRLFVDGREAARISAGESINVPIFSGSHSLTAKIDWCGSPTQRFNVETGKTIEFECGSNLRGFRILLAFVYVLFLRDQYLTLRQV